MKKKIIYLAMFMANASLKSFPQLYEILKYCLITYFILKIHLSNSVLFELIYFLLNQSILRLLIEQIAQINQMNISKNNVLPIIQNKRLKSQANTTYQKYELNKQIQINRYSLQFINKDSQNIQKYESFVSNNQDEVLIPQSYLQSILFKSNCQDNEDSNPQANFKRQKIVFGLMPTDIEQYYSKQIKDKQLTKDKLKSLARRLQAINPLFQKINIAVIQALLQIGSIATYSANQFIYKQNYPIRFIGILLWGQAKLKYKNCNKTFNFIAGNSIGQQLIFQKMDFSSKKFSSVEKGEMFTKERCKAVKNSAFLLIKQSQYDYMVKDFIRWSFKDQIIKFQNILLRNYLKKKPFKRLMN